ncbi:MAG TPA: alpha/beta fold hydrolase [Microvirga sp.]|nr:alpha/beta fold hydrolase [Microvirga sp.]
MPSGRNGPAVAPAAAVFVELDRSAEHIRTRHPGGEMAWRTWGQGPTLLLLHGGHGSWTHWIRNIEALALTHRVIVPDMPGFGESDALPEPTGPGLATALADGLRVVAPGERVAVAGFSFGGVIGGLLAGRPDSPVETLVLVGAVGLKARRNALNLVKWRGLPPAERAEAHRTNLRVLMLWNAERIDALALEFQDHNASRARVDPRPIARSELLTDALNRTDAMLAGIWGEHDSIAAPYLHERRALIRGWRSGAPFAIIPDAGHWVQYEAPEAFNTTLQRVLDEVRLVGYERTKRRA